MRPRRSADIVAFAALVIIALSVFVIRPTYFGLKETNVKVGARAREEQQLSKKIEDLKTWKTEYEKVKGDLENLDLAVPTDKQLPEILVMIEAMAADANVTINTIQPTQQQASASQAQGATAVPVTISGSGAYGNVEGFVKNMEKNLRPVIVKNLNFGAQEKEGATEVSQNFTLELLYAPKAKAQQASPQEATP